MGGKPPVSDHKTTTTLLSFNTTRGKRARESAHQRYGEKAQKRKKTETRNAYKERGGETPRFPPPETSTIAVERNRDTVKEGALSGGGNRRGEGRLGGKKGAKTPLPNHSTKEGEGIYTLIVNLYLHSLFTNLSDVHSTQSGVEMIAQGYISYECTNK